MGTDLGSTSSSLGALTQRFELIAHNLANASTAGFKSSRSSFQAAMRGRSESSSQVSDHPFVDFTQGAIMQTNRPLDFALMGKGFLIVNSAKGDLYTRNGTFSINPDRLLVDGLGRTVSGDNGPISIPQQVNPSDIEVTGDGTLTAKGASLGKMKIVEFEKPTQLISVGDSAFRAPPSVEAKAATATSLRQGYIESSNVNIVQELVGLITVTRMYEANMKSLRLQDERSRNITQVAMA